MFIPQKRIKSILRIYRTPLTKSNVDVHRDNINAVWNSNTGKGLKVGRVQVLSNLIMSIQEKVVKDEETFYLQWF